MKKIAVLCIFLLLISGAFSGSALAKSWFHILKKIPIAGTGGWDYLTMDSASRRLYVSHSAQVEVIDVDQAKVVGTILKTDGVHGIALAPELGRGFTSNGRASTVTIFDLKTFASLGEIATGTHPDAIIYDPSSSQVFAFNGKSQTATVIDAASGKTAGTIDLGGKPEFAAANGQGQVFLNLEDKSEVLSIDAKNLSITARWSLGTNGQEPSSMAMDTKNQRLFIGCGNHVMVVLNAADGRVITTLPIGDHVDAGDFDPKTKLVYCSCGDGTLWVYHQNSADKYSLVQTVQTQKGSRTMALDLKKHRVYLASAEFTPAPTPTAEHPHPWPNMVPGTFSILVVGK